MKLKSLKDLGSIVHLGMIHCLCLFYAIAELHAMDEKIHNIFLIGK